MNRRWLTTASKARRTYHDEIPFDLFESEQLLGLLAESDGRRRLIHRRLLELTPTRLNDDLLLLLLTLLLNILSRSSEEDLSHEPVGS